MYECNQVSPENEDWTIFEQQASLEIKSFWGFEHVVERLAVKHYSQNIKKGQEIIEYHINELAQEGITSMPRYESSSNPNENSDDNDNDEDSDKFSDSLFNNGGSNHIEHQHQQQSANNKNHNGMIISHSQDSVRSPISSNIDDTITSNNHKRSTKNSKFDCIRSNSVEEKIQATKQKILNKCESLKKKSSFENNNGTAVAAVVKTSNNNSNNNAVSLS